MKMGKATGKSKVISSSTMKGAPKAMKGSGVGKGTVKAAKKM